MGESKISVIVPVYNTYKFLPRCIQSIQNQSYSSLEIILIDDGSTDDSLMLCESYAQKDSRIRVLHQNNSGVSSARNKGIDLAIGDYILFVDSDDYIKPDYLIKLINAAVENQADIVCCGYTLDGDNSTATSFVNAEDISLDYQKWMDAYAICLDKKKPKDLKESFGFIVFSKLFKKDFVKETRFKNIKYGEDSLFMIEMMQKQPKTVFDPNNKGYYYYQRESSAVHNCIKSNMYFDHLFYLRELFLFSKEKNYRLKDFTKSFLKGIHTTISALIIEDDKERYFSYRLALLEDYSCCIKGKKIINRSAFFIKCYKCCPKLLWQIYRLFKK